MKDLYLVSLIENRARSTFCNLILLNTVMGFGIGKKAGKQAREGEVTNPRGAGEDFYFRPFSCTLPSPSNLWLPRAIARMWRKSPMFIGR
jgi:hypothetical protein